MQIYKFLPKFIVAYQYDGDFKDSSGKYCASPWVVQALEDGNLFYKEGELYIRKDPIGILVNVSDYLIYNDNGTISKIDAETFEANTVEADPCKHQRTIIPPQWMFADGKQ